MYTTSSNGTIFIKYRSYVDLKVVYLVSHEVVTPIYYNPLLIIYLARYLTFHD